jgi:hypothetical protein
MRDQILSEIKRLAEANGGQAPGRQAFLAATGIREADWLGRYWARWGDAVAEAGFAPNELQGRLSADAVLRQLATAARHYGRMPSEAELRLYGRANPGFPGHSTFNNHFGSKAETTDRLREWVAAREDFADVAAILGPRAAPTASSAPARATNRPDGFVYLIRSGDHHKIGRTDNIERRFKEITIALPATATIEHHIRTDDPAGIETYWHRRFADRRANGEWFKLTPADVTAFKRRKFQ